MIRQRARGFTLMELLIASLLFMMFISLTSVEVASVSRMSRGISRGSAELISATRFSERFRNDVRQAQSVLVQSDGQSITLTLADGVIEYRLSAEKRLERVQANSREIFSGPFVQSVLFSLDSPGDSRRRAIVHARWECLAEIDPQQDRDDPARALPRILILDTALRAEKEQDK